LKLNNYIFRIEFKVKFRLNVKLIMFLIEFRKKCVDNRIEKTF